MSLWNQNLKSLNKLYTPDGMHLSDSGAGILTDQIYLNYYGGEKHELLNQSVILYQI